MVGEAVVADKIGVRVGMGVGVGVMVGVAVGAGAVVGVAVGPPHASPVITSAAIREISMKLFMLFTQRSLIMGYPTIRFAGMFCHA